MIIYNYLLFEINNEINAFQNNFELLYKYIEIKLKLFLLTITVKTSPLVI